MKKYLATFGISLLSIFASAQQDSTAIENLHLNAGLETAHLWRGLIISDKPTITAQLYYDLDKGKHFQIGVWGGMAISNDSDDTHYKEINYYIQYQTGGFSIALWDLFNSRNINEIVSSKDIFNYGHTKTAHILDLRSSYQFKENFPLRLEADVLLYGGANAGEVKLNDNGEYDANKYSTYVEVSYPLIRGKKTNLKALLGGGFAFNPGDNNKGESTFLYGNGKNNFDIVNVGFVASRNLKVFDATIPINAGVLWNPSLKYARVQLSTTLF